MTRPTITITALLVVALAVPASATTYKKIGQKSASGDFAIAIASGTAKHPKGVYVAVFATPKQKVSVNWTLICSKGLGAGSKSGDHETSSNAKRKMRLPMGSPDSCTVSAGGSLARGGKIRVVLYQR